MTIPLRIIHLLMEDITGALCLDNRLRRRLYLTPVANRRSHGISAFIRPIPSSSSFSPSLPSQLPPFLSSPSPIDLAVVFTICQWFMPAGRPPNPLSGRTTVSTLFHSHGKVYGRKGKDGEEACERDWGEGEICFLNI